MKTKFVNMYLEKSLMYGKRNKLKLKMPSHEGFGVRRGVVSWDTSQDFGSFAPVRIFAFPRPNANSRGVSGKPCATLSRDFDSP